MKCSSRRKIGARDLRWARACMGDHAALGDDTAATDLIRSDAELGFEQIVDRLRISLAAGRLHDLADEPADELWLGFRLLDLVRVGGDDVIDDLFDRAEVSDLPHAARLDQRAGIAALLPDNLEQIFCNLA